MMKEHLGSEHLGSEHLGSEGIARWLAGGLAPAAQRHVGECAECAAELARFQATLGVFRASMREWSGRQPGAVPPAAFAAEGRQVRMRRWPAQLALAGTMLLVLAILPMQLIRTRGVDGRTGPAQGQAQADVVLLEQVDTEVSQAVPRPMRPLLRLVAADTATSDGDYDSRNQAGKGTNDKTYQQ